MRLISPALLAIIVLAAPAAAQPPPTPDPAHDPTNPFKLSSVPDAVTPVDIAVPKDLLSPNAQGVREVFGPGREQLADGFQQALERAGFDVGAGSLTKQADGTVTFAIGDGVGGKVTITATPSGNTLALQKVWAPSDQPPIVFRQPAGTAPTPPAPPEKGASILTPFDPNTPIERFTPPPGWTPVQGFPNLYLPPAAPPATTPTIRNSTIGGNTTGGAQGGGILNSGTVNLQNTTVGGNTATTPAGTGGGAIVNPGTLQLQNSTIDGNTKDKPVPQGNDTGNKVIKTETQPYNAVPQNVTITTTAEAVGVTGPVVPADHLIVVNDFKPDAGKPIDGDFKAAVNVTDSGFISGFTLIEGGCDFLDDGVPFRGDVCAGKTPAEDPNWSWPNVMVQVLDQNGFRFVDNNSTPLVRDEARIEKVHILGGGGPELLGRGSNDVIEDLAPATYDDSVQYEVITVRVSIQSAVRSGFNLLRDWLLRRPQEILAMRSERMAFEEQSRSTPSRPATPSRSRPRGAMSLLLTSTGNSTGDAFRVQALANSPITFDLTAVVAEPLKGVKANAITKASTMFGARGASIATAAGYCLEFTRRPPSAGMLYRIAPPGIQKRFEPLRRIANTARKLSEAGELRPDSDPKAYAHSIAQWAIWTGEQKFTQSSFTQAFVDHTKKAVEAAGRPWQREYAQAVEKVAPGRWQQIQRILQVAGM